MKTSQIMIRQGSWLFRYRSWLPLLLIIFAMICMWFERESYNSYCIWYNLFCFLIAFTGQFVRIFAVGYAADRTSGRNTRKQIADEINQTGIYSVVRHPLYVGNFLMWLGVALYTRIWWVVLFFVVVYWMYYERIILTEEDFLHRKFGDDYLAYADRVNSVIPDFRTYVRNKYCFRLKKVMRQEYSAFYGLVLVFLVFDLFQKLVSANSLAGVRLSATWITVASISTVLYLALRTLKKRTRILQNDFQRQKEKFEE